MKKIRNKLILMLILISAFSNMLASLFNYLIISEYSSEFPAAIRDLLTYGIENGLTLVFFSAFVIIGVREITAPVTRLSDAARTIADGSFDVKIPVSRRRDEIGQLERSFDAMVRELKSTGFMQKDFINNVSHEYKTPLSIISGNAKLIKNGVLTEAERAECADYILEEAERLSSMTSNILMLSKLENQGLRPPFAEFDLTEQLRQSALLYIARCEEKELELEIEAPELTLCGNEELLMHVWSNLLDNAVKFSPRGGSIKLSAREDETSVVISVADNGIGMSEETAQRVFDQFYQADTSRQESGSGLGMALVRRIVQLHDGKIEVRSECGEGTTFLVTLPRLLRRFAGVNAKMPD